MYIEWKDEYCIGIERIDEQHQKLIELLNALYRVISTDGKSGETWTLLDQFNQYADEHFYTEERIAVDAGIAVAEFEEHRAEHDAYRLRVKAFCQSHANNDKGVPVQLMAFLSKWWLSHILVKDMSLGRSIRQASGGQV